MIFINFMLSYYLTQDRYFLRMLCHISSKNQTYNSFSEKNKFFSRKFLKEVKFLLRKDPKYFSSMKSFLNCIIICFNSSRGHHIGMKWISKAIMTYVMTERSHHHTEAIKFIQTNNTFKIALLKKILCGEHNITSMQIIMIINFGIIPSSNFPKKGGQFIRIDLINEPHLIKCILGKYG